MTVNRTEHMNKDQRSVIYIEYYPDCLSQMSCFLLKYENQNSYQIHARLFVICCTRMGVYSIYGVSPEVGSEKE
jgi:hypothetical protein